MDDDGPSHGGAAMLTNDNVGAADHDHERVLHENVVVRC